MSQADIDQFFQQFIANPHPPLMQSNLIPLNNQMPQPQQLDPNVPPIDFQSLQRFLNEQKDLAEKGQQRDRPDDKHQKWEKGSKSAKAA